MNPILHDREYEVFANGFVLKKHDLSSWDAQELLRSTRPWEVFTGIQLSCQRNNFDPVERLPNLLKQHDGFLFWSAVSYLAGCAGNWRFIEGFFSQLESKISLAHVRYFLATILGLCCDIRAIEYLLRLHQHSDDADTRYYIENQISFLLESDNGALFFGADDGGMDTATTPPELVGRKEYFDRVRQEREETLAKVKSVDTPVFEGDLFYVADLAERLQARLKGDNQARVRIEQEKIIFEANTGCDTSVFFGSSGNLQSLAALAVLEDFIDSGDAVKFQPGQRYFFGHPIPL